jgi:hypothetical protein
MAVPSSYTETTLKTFMHDILGAVATSLDWSVAAGSYDEILNETLFAYDTDDVTTISGRENLRKLRILARCEVWRAVMGEVSGDYDFIDEGGDNKRSQAFEMASKNYADAAIAAIAYDSMYEVTTETIDFDDPYLPYEE